MFSLIDFISLLIIGMSVYMNYVISRKFVGILLYFICIVIWTLAFDMFINYYYINIYYFSLIIVSIHIAMVKWVDFFTLSKMQNIPFNRLLVSIGITILLCIINYILHIYYYQQIILNNIVIHCIPTSVQTSYTYTILFPLHNNIIHYIHGLYIYLYLTIMVFITKK